METTTTNNTANTLTIGQYTITLGNTPNGEPTLKFQKLMTSGKNKGKFKTLENYKFRNDAHRESYKADLVSRYTNIVKAQQEREEAKKLARKNFVNPFVVDQILYASWGYEQTNIDFYQIIEVKGKTVIVRRIAEVVTERNKGDYGYKKPIKNDFIDAPETKRVQMYINSKNEPVYYIKKDARESLQPYEETEKGVYFSWGY